MCRVAVCHCLPVLALNFLLLFSGTPVFPLPSFRLWRFPVDGLRLEISPPPVRVCCLMGRASLLWLLPAVSSSCCVPQCIVHPTLSLTVKRLIVKMRSDLNSSNLQHSASLFIYRQLLQSIANWSLFNPLNPELNPICYLLALLAHHFPHVSRIRVKSLTLRLLMSYIYEAPILDVSRSHTTTQHSR
jgi:hypothetical protein